MAQGATYRKDLHYINHRVAAGVRSERVVSPWYWWLIRLLAGRRYRVFKQYRVLEEREPARHWSDEEPA